MPSARAGRASHRAPTGLDHSATIAIARDIDLSAIIRAERISNIHYDRLLDRFTVTLLDYSCGGGGTVGDALADARRRS
jgi:hypothetical protein